MSARRPDRWLVALLLLLALDCRAAGIAITVDDLPWVEFAQTPKTEVLQQHRRLLAALDGVPATGFVNEGKLVDDGRIVPWRQQMLDDWLAAGHDLGNHTFDHGGLHQVAVGDFEASILRGERYLRPRLARDGRMLRWFRHPYLHTGRDAATRGRIDRFLREHGYRVAPVTIDNGEWIYARAWLNAPAERARLRNDYLRYMLAKTRFFEQSAQALFGRPIDHVLLLHANALNAALLPDLLDGLRGAGHHFISLEAAVADPAYRHADTFHGRGGISWLHRWALTEGRSAAFFADEPEVPAWVMQLAGVDSE